VENAGLSGLQTKKQETKGKKMTRYKETLEGYLTNGLTWQIEKEKTNLSLTILWANGEPLETIELKLEDVERLQDLFLQAQGIFGAIAPSERKKGATK
jgi:hypothetical protein